MKSSLPRLGLSALAALLVLAGITTLPSAVAAPGEKVLVLSSTVSGGVNS